MPRANKANNRTDLPGKVATTVTAPDQQYGNRTAQEQSMKMLPASAPPGAAGSPSGAQPGAAPVATPAPAGPPASLQAAGSLPWLHPTQRPAEPTTAGMRSGPGPGPAPTGLMGLAQAQMNEQGSLQMLLGHLASQPGASSVIKSLANVAGTRVY